jgi:hypothetical protein
MQSILGVHFAGVELLTGLPEYRNGGLFIDTGVLTLKSEDNERGLQNYADYCRRTGTKAVEVAPMFEPGDDVIVEWRGVTVGFLDLLLVEVNKHLAKELNGEKLSLAQLLEAGSWKVCPLIPLSSSDSRADELSREEGKSLRSAGQIPRSPLSSSTAMELYFNGRCFGHSRIRTLNTLRGLGAFMFTRHMGGWDGSHRKRYRGRPER